MPLMRSVIRHRGMRNSALYLFFLLVIGCSTGIVVHDETRAAELIVDFLSGFKSDKGKKLSYEWTDDRFKEEVSLGEFSRIVSSIRSKNQGAETIIVYASSEVNEAKMYFRFILVGTKSKDYYLLNLDINDSEFSKKGIYKEYEQSILVKGV
ncbi:MAG: hypothetical protein ACYTBY_03705 [Planctomycetota bacterium]